MTDTDASKPAVTNLECSYPGCQRHPSKGDDILRISAKGKGMPFIGRCREHYGDRVPDDLEWSIKLAKAVRW